MTDLEELTSWTDQNCPVSIRGKAIKYAGGSKAMTIAGGSSEVQLNIISKRVLGLPD
jgi:alkylation response protein AidB-like acyl-CoA dehydrogenase|tara:strand:+ start:2320 stop:2490 length:171 start_codon:yes stop_codon:yes gene_type:complete